MKYVEGSFLTGPAGSGKTSDAKKRRDANPTSIIFSASTGIASVNLGEGVTTIHSLLYFFDDASLSDKYYTGRLTRRLVELMESGMEELVLDECSMFSGEALETIWKAMEEASERRFLDNPNKWQPFRFTILGDICQLPPVNAKKWCYEADIWDENIAPHIRRLDKIYRQTNPMFLEGLTAARRGCGGEAAGLFESCGVKFAPEIDDCFDGATLVGTNDKMNRYNFLRLKQLSTKTLKIKSERWTVDGVKEPSEWKHIPEEGYLRLDALVMLKINDLPDFRFGNGDLATVVDWVPQTGKWLLKLQRNGLEIEIGQIVRRIENRRLPEWVDEKKVASTPEEGKRLRLPYRDLKKGVWVLGEIKYFPIKLAWAITVHSSQGLTLDNVQIDWRQQFMAEPALAYVALSRARTPQGLRLVGNKDLLARRIKLHPKAAPWV